jgi:hypothetical protein
MAVAQQHVCGQQAAKRTTDDQDAGHVQDHSPNALVSEAG